MSFERVVTTRNDLHPGGRCHAADGQFHARGRQPAQTRRRIGLELTDTLADVVAEIGTGSYFVTFAETYAPLVSRAGLLPAKKVEAWHAEQRRALEQGTFFAACNYYAYLAKRT